MQFGSVPENQPLLVKCEKNHVFTVRRTDPSGKNDVPKICPYCEKEANQGG